MSLSLPDRPNLEQLRKQAKDLLKAHRQGDASACRILRHLARFAAVSDRGRPESQGHPLRSAARAGAGVRFQELGGAGALHQGQCATEPGMEIPRDALGMGECAEGRPHTISYANDGKESEAGGKCRLCDSPGTIHVTDKTETGMVERHFCVKHAVEANVFPPAIIRNTLYPAKYTMVVPLTQEQVERQAVVPVTLPDGSVIPIRFPRDAVDGLVITVWPRAQGYGEVLSSLRGADHSRSCTTLTCAGRRACQLLHRPVE